MPEYRDKYQKAVYLLELDRAIVEAVMVEKGMAEFSPAVRYIIREWYELTHKKVKKVIAAESSIMHEPAMKPVEVFDPDPSYKNELEFSGNDWSADIILKREG